MTNVSGLLRDLPRRSWPWALVVFAAMLAVYIRTLLPGILGGDAGELQYAGPLLALTHPTGYPLYSMLGFIWSRLIPFGAVAYRITLLAAVCGALTCAIVAWLLHRWHGNAVIAVACGVMLGLGATFWGQAVMSDKYAFASVWSALVAGLAVWWAAEYDKPYGDKLLYALSLAFGLSLLHHRSMATFVPGLALLVIIRLRSGLWKNWRRTLICLALVILPALIVYPLYLPFVRARGLSPLVWQPNSPSEWLDWILERHVLTGEALVFDSSGSIGDRLLGYGQTLLHDYTPVVALAALVGLAAMFRRNWMGAGYLLLTFVLIAGFAANFRGTPRYYIYYLPSFPILMFACGAGLNAIWRLARQRLEKQPRWIPVASALGAMLLLIAPIYQFAQTYPQRRLEATYGDPLDPWRQNIRTANMGDRLVADLDELPQKAVVVGDWEQTTVLWYEQKVEGVRPDLTLVYPIDRLGDYDSDDRPVCVARTLPLGEEWHPTSVGPLVCLNRQPDMSLPQGFTPLGKALYTPEGDPRLELAAFRLGLTTIRAGQYAPVVLSWRALVDHPEDYSISLHILTEGWQQVWAQDIAAPALGMYPTSRWVRGEVVQDYHEFAIPREMPPGRYLWTVVVYRQLEDGSFVQLHDADGNIEVLGGTFEVVAR